jgi:hypothetical protein
MSSFLFCARGIGLKARVSGTWSPAIEAHRKSTEPHLRRENRGKRGRVRESHARPPSRATRGGAARTRKAMIAAPTPTQNERARTCSLGAHGRILNDRDGEGTHSSLGNTRGCRVDLKFWVSTDWLAGDVIRGATPRSSR